MDGWTLHNFWSNYSKAHATWLDTWLIPSISPLVLKYLKTLNGPCTSCKKRHTRKHTKGKKFRSLCLTVLSVCSQTTARVILQRESRPRHKFVLQGFQLSVMESKVLSSFSVLCNLGPACLSYFLLLFTLCGQSGLLLVTPCPLPPPPPPPQQAPFPTRLLPLHFFWPGIFSSQVCGLLHSGCLLTCHLRELSPDHSVLNTTSSPYSLSATCSTFLLGPYYKLLNYIADWHLLHCSLG